ncbi:hypothetical protein, variant [Allomyces macrogynus ATCC 38327]|nr:hypothetical protein, variant [Allomyces macrogynus ATCC 38327]|eukprot:KNE70913.1 hypothetical protein, variant [Allomyces macrogynus ATCC 38327]
MKHNTAPLPKNANRMVRVHPCLTSLASLLTAPLFSRWPLHVHVVSPTWLATVTSTLHLAPHRRLTSGPLTATKSLPPIPIVGACRVCRTHVGDGDMGVECPWCAAVAHLVCWANAWRKGSGMLLPVTGPCIRCETEIEWGALVREAKVRTGVGGGVDGVWETAESEEEEEDEGVEDEVEDEYLDVDVFLGPAVPAEVEPRAAHASMASRVAVPATAARREPFVHDKDEDNDGLPSLYARAATPAAPPRRDPFSHDNDGEDDGLPSLYSRFHRPLPPAPAPAAVRPTTAIDLDDSDDDLMITDPVAHPPAAAAIPLSVDDDRASDGDEPDLFERLRRMRAAAPATPRHQVVEITDEDEAALSRSIQQMRITRDRPAPEPPTARRLFGAAPTTFSSPLARRG